MYYGYSAGFRGGNDHNLHQTKNHEPIFDLGRRQAAVDINVDEARVKANLNQDHHDEKYPFDKTLNRGP